MKNQRWYRLYEAAILRLEAPQLKERLDAVDAAIGERFAELQGSAGNDKELRLLAEARDALDLLRRNELQSPA
jgi:hypothetical protein